MVKNFYEYVKELIPEKGEVFFTRENHSVMNNISLYQLADLLCGQKISYADDVTGYSWNVKKIYDYGTDMIGLMFLFKEGNEKWIHFSRKAFIGAICLVAIRNGITFETGENEGEEGEYEDTRKIWEDKLKGTICEEDRKYVIDLDETEPNFSEEWFYGRKHPGEIRKHQER